MRSRLRETADIIQVQLEEVNMSRKHLTLILRLALVVPMLLAFVVVPVAANSEGGSPTTTTLTSSDIHASGVSNHLRLKKTADRDIVPAGWVIHYTIRVTNDTGIAASVTVTDVLPGGVKLVSAGENGTAINGRVYWKLSVPAGATRFLHVSVRPYTTMRGTIVNKAIATWGDFTVSATKRVTVVAP